MHIGNFVHEYFIHVKISPKCSQGAYMLSTMLGPFGQFQPVPQWCKRCFLSFLCADSHPRKEEHSPLLFPKPFRILLTIHWMKREKNEGDNVDMSTREMSLSYDINPSIIYALRYHWWGAWYKSLETWDRDKGPQGYISLRTEQTISVIYICTWGLNIN